MLNIEFEEVKRSLVTLVISVLFFNWAISWSKFNLFKLKRNIDEIFNKKVRSGVILVKNILLYLMLIILILIQNEMQFLHQIQESQIIPVAVSVLTLYGIFLAFVQFLIGYNLESNSDNYWGKSKSNIYLEESIGFRFLNSLEFKFILIYVVAYSLFSNKIIGTLNPIWGYDLLYKDIYSVFLAIIICTYVLLFIKFLEIKIRIHNIEEKYDRFIKFRIKRITNRYFENLFYEVIIDQYNIFSKSVFKYMEKIKSEERTDFILSNIREAYWFYDGIREKQGISLQKLLMPKNHDTSAYAYRIKDDFEYFWDHLQYKNIELAFEDLVSIYSVQQTIILNELTRNNDSNVEVVNDYLSLNDNKAYGRLANVMFDIPDYLYENIKDERDIFDFFNTLDNIKIVGILRDYREEFKCEVEILKVANKCYVDVIRKVIKCIIGRSIDFSELKILMNIIDDELYYFDKVDDFSILGLNNLKKYSFIKYALNMDNDYQHKQFFLKLSDFLETKDIVSYICYRLIYPGSNSSKWKMEVEYFKELIDKKDIFDFKFDKQLSKYVYSFLARETLITHRIKEHHIEWIFENLKTTFNNEIVGYLLKSRYIDMLLILKFRYIFNDNYYCRYNMFDLTKLDVEKFILQYDTRFGIARKIIDEVYLLNIEYFRKCYEEYYNKILLENMPDDFFTSPRVEDYIVGLRPYQANKLFASLYKSRKELIIDNGVIDFLVVQLWNPKFRIVLKNEELGSFFSSKVLESIEKKELSINDYVNFLRSKYVLLNRRLSIVKCNRIKKELNELIEYNFNM